MISLKELSLTTFLTTFATTEFSKENFKEKIPVDIQHLICQKITRQRPDLLERLDYFSDPHAFQIYSVRCLSSAALSHCSRSVKLSDLKIAKLLLSAFPNLKKLNLERTKICLTELDSSKIEELNLESCYKITTQGWLTIKDKFPYLKKLILTRTEINSLQGLAGLPLEELNLSWCFTLPAQELLTIKDTCRHLKKLNLSFTHIDSLEGLAGLQLEELNLAYCKKLTAKELLTIQDKCPSLKKLKLSLGHLTEDQMFSLKNAAPLLNVEC